MKARYREALGEETLEFVTTLLRGQAADLVEVCSELLDDLLVRPRDERVRRLNRSPALKLGDQALELDVSPRDGVRQIPVHDELFPVCPQRLQCPEGDPIIHLPQEAAEILPLEVPSSPNAGS